MKKIIYATSVLLLTGTIPLMAQMFPLRGLEIYNPSYYNPAYTQADRKVQLDLVGYNFNYYSGLWTNAMTALPGISSAAGIRFSTSQYSDVGTSWNLEFAYAYRHSFSEDFQLNGGISVKYGHINYENGLEDSNGNELLGRNSTGMSLGVYTQYKKWDVGLSTHLPLYVTKEVVMPDGSQETQKDDAGYYAIHLISSYSFGKPGRMTIDPVLGLDYYISRRNELTELQGYLGAKLEFRNLVGLGFTFGNLVSVSTSLNLKDRVSLILGIYAGEHELFGSMEGGSYSIGSHDFDIIAQVRIHL